jgi:hypothetical protein
MFPAYTTPMPTTTPRSMTDDTGAIKLDWLEYRSMTG